MVYGIEQQKECISVALEKGINKMSVFRFGKIIFEKIGVAELFLNTVQPLFLITVSAKLY